MTKLNTEPLESATTIPGNNAKMREAEDLSKHEEIIAEAREKYTVHHCDQCEFRKSCINEFDSEECKKLRQSIMLGFGIEDGYFTKLLDRLEAAHKRECGATCKKSSQVGNAEATCNTLNTKSPENVNSEKVIYNNAKMREALMFAYRQLTTAIEDDEVGGNVLYLAGCMRVVANKCFAAISAPPEPTGNNAKMREGGITFTEAIEHMRRGAMVREKGTSLWTWRGASGRCYYGLKRNHPLQFRDTFLCAEVFGDGEWEVKDEEKGGAS